MTDLHQPYAQITGPSPRDGEEGLALLALAVEAEVHRGGWEQEAIFGMLWRGEHGSVRWRTQDIPPWYYVDPSSGLLTMAEVLERPATRAASSVLVTPDFVGWAAVIESWMLDIHLDSASAAQLADAHRAGRTRTVHQHPDRVKARCFFGAAVDGRFVVLVRKRDQLPELLDKDGAAYFGRVPEALRRLAEAGRVALSARQS